MPSPVADYLRSTYIHLNVQGVPMERQALQLLLSQQAKYAVIDEAQLSRLSIEPDFSGLAVVGDIGLPQLLRVASRKDWPELAGIISAALHAIPARDLEQLHARWLQPKYPRLSESPGLWQNLTLLLLVMLLACFAIVVWQRRQQQSLEQSLLLARDDISRRQASEKALRLTQFSIDQSTVGILWVNWDSHVRYANRAAEAMLGYAAGGVVDRPLIDFEPGLHMDRWLNLWKRARSTDESPQSFETHCVRADGSILPTDVSLSFLRFSDAEYLVVFLTDVTERREHWRRCRKAKRACKGSRPTCRAWCFAWSGRRSVRSRNSLTSAKAVKVWSVIRRRCCAIRTWGYAIWCTPKTALVTTWCRTVRLTATATGRGKVGF